MRDMVSVLKRTRKRCTLTQPKSVTQKGRGGRPLGNPRPKSEDTCDWAGLPCQVLVQAPQELEDLCDTFSRGPDHPTPADGVAFVMGPPPVVGEVLLDLGPRWQAMHHLFQARVCASRGPRCGPMPCLGLLGSCMRLLCGNNFILGYCLVKLCHLCLDSQ